MIMGIETSDDYVGVGLADRDGILVSRASAPELRNKNRLHQFLEETLSAVGFDIRDIKGVAVSIGPGSFTGLRVGLAAAKGICWSINVPLAAISSTEAIIECCGRRQGKFLAVKDARRNEFYYGGFESDGAKWNRILPDKAGSASDISILISEGYKIAGRRDQIKDSIPGLSNGDICGYSPDDLGGIIALLGRDRLLMNKNIDIASASPYYVRNPGIGRVCS